VRARKIGWELWALAAIVLGGLLLRVWLETLWRPGFMGFPDTNAYLAAIEHRFSDFARPPGYPLLLEPLWNAFHDLELIIVLQHMLGLATVVLAWLLARMLGAPSWASLLPAAVVAFGGAQILLEHAFLSEGPFAFLLVAAFTAVAAGAGERAPQNRWRYAWFALAGLTFAVATLMRTYTVLVLLPALVFIVLADRRPRHALAASCALLLPCVVVLLAVMSWHNHATGRFALVETQFYNYYGRVATFVDCDEFTPAKNARALCPRQPVSERRGQRYWDFNPESPLVMNYEAVFGAPPRPGVAGAVKGFVRQAVINQPGDYLRTVARDSWRIFNPGFPLNPNPEIGNSMAGPGPDQMRSELTDYSWSNIALMTIVDSDMRLYGSYRPVDGFFAYESVARLSDVRIALLLLLALLAPLLTAGVVRRGALMIFSSALLLIMFPILVNMYNYRYIVPILPLIAVAAALGLAASVDRVRVASSERARRRTSAAAPH
jgi:4-amino-4-deoxy-L-arabinose transferase-like glycosyltransferase